MTNEEAREQLELMKVFIGYDAENPLVKKMQSALDLAIKALEQYCEDAGELSDGCHTFNQLYHQRAVLFACVVKQNKNKAWKSFKHSDGKYCFDSDGEWFIVGVDTPQGSYTYHYSKEYWDMFDCQELECGKEWDGHTEDDVNRLLSLEQQPKTADMVLKLDKRVIDEAVQKAVEDIKQNFIAKSEVIEWLNSFDTNSVTKCYEAVNLLKERVEHEET